MSYPQFNLTTLQLPAPASNMTRAEYKAAYGIDLDEVNIKAFKLVLLGNEKYPIDQIKEVEDGYEIYFNGRILSITDIVQTSDEVYDVANSKPIYWHGIELVNASSNVLKSQLHAHILSNSPAEIDTFDKLTAWFNNQDSSVFVYLDVHGILQLNNEGVEPITIYRRANETTLNISYVKSDASGYALESDISLSTLFTAIKDAVNKVN